MDELRSWFEVPAIAHYFHVFRDAFDLIDFDIEDFEETLLVDGSDNVSSFIPDLLIRLLRGLYKTKEGLQVTLDNYDHYLQDLLNFHYGALQKKENPLINSTFKHLQMRTKVEIIYDMINWRLDLEDAMELTKNMEAEEMRVEPVGKDNDGNVYWYFYGSRLYTEGYSVKNEESQDESEVKVKNIRVKKRKKKPVAQTRSGRAIKKRRKTDSSSEESGDESEKSVEIPDDDSTTSNSLKNNGKSLKLNVSHNVWSLICTTLDNWQGVIENFRGATTKNEKHLFNNLQELFESIPDIIKSREEKVQKKLLAMAPRRVSDRITYRMQLREEDEKMQEQERLLKKQQKAKEDEEKQKKLEVEKAVEREKRYKEREKMLEQRALRAKLREEQKIVRVHPEMVNALTPTFDATLKLIKKEGDSSEPEEDNDYSSMSIVLEGLKEHDDAWLFLQPVKEEEAPNYYTYIKYPMDFQTIGDNIKSKAYKDKYEFENDVLLVFDNCETYNGTYSPFTKLAFKVKKQFHKLMKREFPRDIHEDDDDFFKSDDNPTKSKKVKTMKNSLNLSHPVKNSSFYPTPLQVKKERKQKKDKITVPTSDATPKICQPKPRAVHVIQEKPQVSQLSPISATNFLSTRFGIPPYVLKQMSPAQMQSLILRYPRAGFVPALQGLMGHKLNVSSGPTTPGTSHTNVCNVVGTTTLSPLHQLANTALAPSSAPSPASVKSVSIALPILPKNVIPGPIPKRAPHEIRMLNSSTLGRPRKNTLASASIVSTSTGGYVSGLSVSGVPVTIQWDELKKQLMAQMLPTTSSPCVSLPASKYVSGVTVSGAPITIEWEELKKQLVSQMKKEDNSSTPLNKENIALSLLHLNSGGHSIVGKTPGSALPGPSNLKPNLVSIGSINPISGITNIRPNMVAKSSSSSMPIIPNLRPNMASTVAVNSLNGVHPLRPNIIALASGNSISAIPKSNFTPISTLNAISSVSNIRPKMISLASPGALSGIPTLRPNIAAMTSGNSMSGIPSLRPVNLPAAVPIRLTAAATTTTNAKMFSFSNVLKNKELSTSPAKPVTIKTPTFDCSTSAAVDIAKTTSPLPLSGVRLQSGHAKVQDWLQSSSPFIAQNDNIARQVSKVTTCIPINEPVEAKVTGCVSLPGRKPVFRFVGSQISPIVQPTSTISKKETSGSMEYIPRPSFLSPTSKIVPIPLPNVHHVVPTIANNSMNVIPIKVPVSSQPRTITSVAGKSNLLDLQKAALQAAAVNQISSKLQHHLKKDQQKDHNYIIKNAVIGNSKLKKVNDIVTVYRPNDVIAAPSTVVMSHLNKTPSNQLLNSANLLTASVTNVPITQSRVLIMPNRQPLETSTTSSSSIMVDLPIATPIVSQNITSRFNLVSVTTPSPKVNSGNPTSVSSSTFGFVKAPIPIQIPISPGSSSMTTVPSTKYVTFSPKPIAVQPSQLSKLIVPSVPTLPKIPQGQTLRFQTITSDVPLLQPKSTITNKQFIVQQRSRDQGQGQTVRYILPAQTQLPGGQIINLNQLGSVQNLFINNTPIVKNQTTKNVRIVSGNVSNGFPKSTNITNNRSISDNKVLVSPSLGIHRLPNTSSVLGIGGATQVKINDTIVMRSPVKEGTSVDNPRLQMVSIPGTNLVNSVSKKPDSVENTIICTSATFPTRIELSSLVNNQIAGMPRQPVLLQATTPPKVELNSKSSALARQSILLQSPIAPKIESHSQNENKASTPPKQSMNLQMHSHSETRKLLPKTSSLPNGLSIQPVLTSSSGGIKSPDGKNSEKQKHIVLDSAQLQKLKEEGRIMMTQTGQLIMIPPNLVGKVPGSVFK